MIEKKQHMTYNTIGDIEVNKDQIDLMAWDVSSVIDAQQYVVLIKHRIYLRYASLQQVVEL